MKPGSRKIETPLTWLFSLIVIIVDFLACLLKIGVISMKNIRLSEGSLRDANLASSSAFSLPIEYQCGLESRKILIWWEKRVCTNINFKVTVF